MAGELTLAMFQAYGVTADVYGGLSTADVTNALDTAWIEMMGYLQSQGTLPLRTPYPLDLCKMGCRIAAEDVMTKRGVSPEVKAFYSDRAEKAVGWLKRVASGDIKPIGLLFADGDPSPTIDQGFRATSKVPRGFDRIG